MPPDEVLWEVRAWISKGEGDFRNIELVMPAEDAPFDTVCFHAQQAAEKYLKALLTFRGIPFGKTHDLSEFILLLPEDSSIRGSCGDLADLADAAVASRYPDDLVTYDRDLAEELVQQAKAVRSAVLEELGRLGYARPD